MTQTTAKNVIKHYSTQAWHGFDKGGQYAYTGFLMSHFVRDKS